MKVLVIGGTGLISTAITRQLLARGDDVTLFNRGKSERRLPDGAKFLIGDRKDYAAFEAQMAGTTWDAVIDMIGFVPEDAQSALRAFASSIGHYLFCSTVCVYGGSLTRLPAREDEERTPTGPYGKNKALCEDLLLTANEMSGFPATVLRPSHTYGEGGTIVHSLGGSTTFIDRIRKGRPVVVHGDGNSLWASCHIDDVAAGFVAATGNRKAVGRCYNLTGEEWMTWNEYVSGVAEAVGGEAKIVHIPTDLLAKLAPERTDPTFGIFQYNSVFDNFRAREDLGFAYRTRWVDGVRRTVEWLDARGTVQNCDSDPFDDGIIETWELLSDQALKRMKEKGL